MNPSLLQNFYGDTGPAPQDYPKVVARVSPIDHVFLSTLLPNLHRKYDVILSTLYARFIAELRTRLTDTSPIYDTDDPRWDTIFACLYDELPGCPTRRNILHLRQEARARDDAAGTRGLREAEHILAGLLSDEEESPTRGGGDDSGAAKEERLSEPSGGLAEGPSLDSETNSLLALLRR